MVLLCYETAFFTTWLNRFWLTGFLWTGRDHSGDNECPVWWWCKTASYLHRLLRIVAVNWPTTDWPLWRLLETSGTPTHTGAVAKLPCVCKWIWKIYFKKVWPVSSSLSWVYLSVLVVCRQTEKPPLSPLPVRRSHATSPRKVSTNHSVYVSPHKPTTSSVMTPQSHMLYCFNRSPARVCTTDTAAGGVMFSLTVNEISWCILSEV